MISLLFIVALAILIRATVYLLAARKSRVIKFVGPRGTGKTRTLNALMGISAKTVPTLESYRVVHKGITIHDVIQKDGDLLERYGIDDPSAIYFFFLRSVDDLDGFPEAKGFDIKFVCCRECDSRKAAERNIIVLDKNLAEIENHFP
ncbi:hypothetical protein [Encephalitozoon cuniculi GB-M1]|uniref:G domain-containing protein n=2 Tax=Encephalitozoon cuniculi TaxID=6035 RepID=Q8STP4_ENCCU|nr:uncharacterized protein ECU09_1340 [Encephalitozoon cuniculi GB-M1]AGE96532.1 hypothetical protein ECU09_1340 [Encephalitozoon cuniculi]KMV65402.1 hypothetical protein M970_091330 [Encephalitozoon cuniculi EcunIII-L]UYI26822.1 ADP-ribosylation factor [Encephalitozoon cuniculi]CAD27105.1 hypothetical protein [Encephalitozoon cuniculi GB-M1]